MTPAATVHEVVRYFVAEVEEFNSDDLAEALRSAGHAELAQRLCDDPDLVEALVNEHTA
jgi:hypothetical protein